MLTKVPIKRALEIEKVLYPLLLPAMMPTAQTGKTPVSLAAYPLAILCQKSSDYCRGWIDIRECLRFDIA